MPIRNQIRPVLTLALPLIAAELGWMAMGIVDTVMVGHMENPAMTISAAALGQVFYNTVAFGIAGVCFLGSTLISQQSHGAGRFDEANRWLYHGLILASVLAVVLMIIVGLAPRLCSCICRSTIRFWLGRLGFCGLLTGGTPSLGFLYFTLRRYLRGFQSCPADCYRSLSLRMSSTLPGTGY